MSGTIVVGDVLSAKSVGAAGAGTTTTGTAAASEATSGMDVDGPAVLALAVVSGIVIGAGVAVLASRRRGSHHEEPATPQAA